VTSSFETVVEMPAPARNSKQRKHDALDRLEQDVDAWVATADRAAGTPYLVPLSFLWDGTSLLFATPASSPTGRNLQSAGTIRVGIGPTRDVVLIDGTVRVLSLGEISQEVGDAFAVKTGFDPRRETNTYVYFRVLPERLQAWREENELDGRLLMRDGRWLVE
jgi:hypothetical protein